MKLARFGAVMVAMWVVLLLPEKAWPRVYFGIGVGTSSFHDYSCFGCRPYHRWHDGYYRWLDRGRYVWMDRGRYYGPCGLSHRPFYRRSPLCSSGISLRIRDCCPIVLDPPQYHPKPKYDENTAKLFSKLRRKKNDLLGKLGHQDMTERKKAIAELAGFSFDDRVRAALQKILLSEPDAELRKEAVRSFGKVKNRRAVPALEKASKEDADLQVRDEARKAIKKIRGY